MYWNICTQHHVERPCLEKPKSSKPNQTKQLVTTQKSLTIGHQWAHLVHQVGVIACRVWCWVRPLMPFLPRQPAWHLPVPAGQQGGHLTLILCPIAKYVMSSAIGSYHVVMMDHQEQGNGLRFFRDLWASPLVNASREVFCASCTAIFI